MLFEGVKNVESSGYEQDLPVFTVIEPTVEEWNNRAEKQNTKMFIKLNNRIPQDYNEVLNWIYSHSKEKSHLAVTR